MSKILVSNDTSDTGQYTQINSSINNDKISATNIVTNTASINFPSTNGLLYLKNGNIEAITGSSLQNNYGIYYESGLFKLKENIPADLGGDLSGSYTNAKVKGIGNVTTGVLSASYGGTGVNNFTIGSLLTTSGSGLTYSGNANKSVAVGLGGQYVFVDKNISQFTPMTGTIIYLYTGSVNITRTFTWKKPGVVGSDLPNVGTPRFIRVICQGGGSGGGAGGLGGSTNTALGGIGGSGGGFSDVIYNSNFINNSVEITVGSGGLGGITNYAIGNDGGSSSFGNYVYSSGGNRGIIPSSYTAISGGIGYSENGGSANAGSTSKAAAGGGEGATGRGGGSYIAYSGSNGGNCGLCSGGLGGRGVSLPSSRDGMDGTSSDGCFLIKGNCYLNNNFTNLIEIPKLVYGGGGGGGNIYSITNVRAGDGGDGFFGSGGGGGGGSNSRKNDGVNSGNGPGGYGGDGGPGYVLIICY